MYEHQLYVICRDSPAPFHAASLPPYCFVSSSLTATATEHSVTCLHHPALTQIPSMAVWLLSDSCLRDQCSHTHSRTRLLYTHVRRLTG